MSTRRVPLDTINEEDIEVTKEIVNPVKCDGLSICIPEQIRCSIISSPFFWIILIGTIAVLLISINNIDDLLNDKNGVWIKLVWSLLLIVGFLIPTVYSMSSLKSIFYCRNESQSITYSRCLFIGYILMLIFLLLQSYCFKFRMISISTLLSVTMILILTWMSWVVYKLGKGRIASIIGYCLLIVWLLVMIFINNYLFE